MEELVKLNSRGTFTLPREIRKRAGIPAGSTVRVKFTSEGILITPVVAYPIEMYTDERLKEFAEEESKLTEFKF